MHFNNRFHSDIRHCSGLHTSFVFTNQHVYNLIIQNKSVEWFLSPSKWGQFGCARFSKSVHIWNTQHSWFETLNKYWNENINLCYLLGLCEWFRSLPCANIPYQQLCIVAVMQLVKRIKRKWKQETKKKICIIIII